MRASMVGMVLTVGCLGLNGCNLTVAPASKPKPSKTPVASASPSTVPSSSPSPLKSVAPTATPKPTPTPTPTPGPPASDAEVSEATAFPFTRVGQKWEYKLTIKIGALPVEGTLTLEVLEVTATGARVKAKTEVALLQGKPQEAERVITRTGGNPYAQINAAISGAQDVTSTPPKNTKESVTVPAGSYASTIRSQFSSVSGASTADFNLWMVKDIGMVKESISSDKPPASLGTLLGSGMSVGTTTTSLELKAYNPGNGVTVPVTTPSGSASAGPVASPSPATPSATPTVGPAASASDITDATAFPFTQVGQKWEYTMGLTAGSLSLPGTMTLEVTAATATGAKLKIGTSVSGGLPIPLPPQSVTRDITRTGGNPYAQINSAVSGSTEMTNTDPVYTRESVTVPNGTFANAVRAKFSSSGSGLTADFDMWLVKDKGMVKESISSNKPPSSLATYLGAVATTTTLELKTFTPASTTALQRAWLAVNWPAFTVQ